MVPSSAAPGDGPARPVAVVTGVGRRVGIGAAIAVRLAADGFDLGLTSWSAYDRRMPWGADEGTEAAVDAAVAAHGASTTWITADLERPSAAVEVFDAVEARLGSVSALVLCHCESVDAGLFDTTVESFDRHLAVNARASWLLIRELGRRFRGPRGAGRIVALTSDHTVGNLAYGASKAALDRITIAAARELAAQGITANVVNPGAVDTGWMSDDIRAAVRDATPGGRIGEPEDVADLVSFLCSTHGGWVNGQLLVSDGGAASR
jgi:3-oxoacyl-[acyl-carrier protein] reductase